MAEGPRPVCSTLDELVAQARTLVASLDPSVLSTATATRAVEGFAQLEKLAASGRLVCASRAAEGREWSGSGHRSVEHWLAHQTGGSVADAHRAVSTSRRLGRCPGTAAALRRGDLSASQAAEVSAAAVADPSAEERLVAMAMGEPMARLREEALRIRAAADGPGAEKRARRHRSRRFLRFWSGDDGEVRFSGSCGVLQGAGIREAIERWRDPAFRAARDEGRREPFDATTLDALDLALQASLGHQPNRAETTAPPETGADPDPSTPPDAGADRGNADDPATATDPATADEPKPTRTPGPASPTRPSGSARHKIIVHVSYEALLRGGTVRGEVCEIDGVGPLPVSQVHDLLAGGDAFLAAVLVDGVDVHKVVHVGRNIPAVVRTALEVRDRCCVVPGCGNTGYFEIDHTTSATGFADTRRTMLDELGRLCLPHHLRKTRSGWLLEGGPGHWQWLPPHSAADTNSTATECAGTGPADTPRCGAGHAGSGRSPPDRPAA